MRLTQWMRGNRMRRAGISRGLACLGAFVFACTLFGADAKAEDRTISFKQVHTGETLTVTYKRNGRYDAAAMAKINYILRDWRRNESTRMDPRLVDTLWEAHKLTGSREPINVLSGYRSPVTNAMLRSRSNGVAKHSQHMLGKATDFFLPDVPLAKLRAVGMKMEHGGVGYYPTSGSPFVHLDVGGVRAWPRMTRQQLLALFPNGNTAHLPADGKPLPGYERALARVEREKGSEPRITLASTSSGSDSDPARLSRGENGQQRRGLLASLFSNTQDEEEESTGTPAQQVVESSPPQPEQSVTLASAVPLPSRRPEDVVAAPGTLDAQRIALAAVPMPSSAGRPTDAEALALQQRARNDLIAQLLASSGNQRSDQEAEAVRVAMAISPDRIHMPEAKPALTASALGLRSTSPGEVADGRSSLTALIPPSTIKDPIAAALAAAPPENLPRESDHLVAPDHTNASVTALIRDSAETRNADAAVAAWRIDNAFQAFGYMAKTPGRLTTNRFTGPAVRVFERSQVMSFRAS
ncbi:MAG: DUF882 domain-containing protein [Rhodobiaceae bacterium]|nr:DUF882 domain-containing protein [Rhodobiaceae bacterium]MCC0057222.1 DUF882 domain-containing protein [Rhodobiaceae bacterium]